MKKPKNRKYKDDLKNIEVGDIVYDECHGPCSGGRLYDVGDRVTKITILYIHTTGTKYLNIPPYQSANSPAINLVAYTKDERE